jgi:hypothetical protein
MIYKCDKCKKEIIEKHEHHIWPKFMDNPHGNNYNCFISRCDLCIECHVKIHEVIKFILQKFSQVNKYTNEYYLWKNIRPENKKECIKEIVIKTIELIKNE